MLMSDFLQQVQTTWCGLPAKQHKEQNSCASLRARAALGMHSLHRATQAKRRAAHRQHRLLAHAVGRKAREVQDVGGHVRVAAAPALPLDGQRVLDHQAALLQQLYR